MADTVTATPTTPTQADPKQTAANIAKAVTDKANGKAPKQDQPITPNGAAAPDPNAGKEKYVVNGREVWLTPDQARAYVQKGIAFEPKVDELARLQRETAAFLNDLKTNPAKILLNNQLGHTPESVFENIMASAQISDAIKEKVGKWYYDNVIVPGKMSPEQLKAREDAKWRAERERLDASAKDQAVEQENRRKFEVALSQIKAQIGEAMKESGLPSNDTPLGAEMARMVADAMRLAHFQKQAITPKQAIEFVKKRIKAVQAAYYDGLADEELVKELGEANADKVKKYFLKLAKAADKEIPRGQSAPKTRPGDRKVMNLDQFHDYLDELKKKG